VPRSRTGQAALHREADRFEPRVARAMERAAARLQARISEDALASAIAAGDVRRAVATLPDAAVRDALTPVAAIARDAFVRGGQLGAAEINAALGREVR
jgi:hypothetical protein